MILIADSGSTKVDWQLIDSEESLSFQTRGMNPYFVEKAEIVHSLQNSLVAPYQQNITQLYFYGAGCGTSIQRDKIATALTQVFPKAQIQVMDDLLGAARATCGHSDGIVCILGTGSNSCLFKNGRIRQSSPSNGIWLGDEGSAGYLGKQLITDYLNEELPIEVKDLFETKFADRRAEILQQVYQAATPNSYLASFSKFIAQHLNHPYCADIVYQAFDQFCNRTICKYPNFQQLPIHFVGSVAHHYITILNKVLTDKGLQVHQILRKPIEGLTRFHSTSN